MKKITIARYLITIFGIGMSLAYGTMANDLMNVQYSVYAPSTIDTSTNPTVISYKINFTYNGMIYEINISSVTIEFRNGSKDGPIIAKNSSAVFLMPHESKIATITITIDNKTAAEIVSRAYTVYYVVKVYVKVQFYGREIVSAVLEQWDVY